MTRPVVLIVGGAGVFGRRLAQGLIEAGGCDVILAGRSLRKAQTAARDLGAAGAVALDRTAPDGAALKRIGARIVIDAAGPFQNSSYGFARAVIAAGAHYIDLADGRAFVAGFAELDREARAAGVAAVTGASSTPALTHAVLDQMTRGWRRIDVIEAGITPGNRAPRGRGAIGAVLSWIGAPVRVFEDGAWRMRRGFSGAKRVSIEGLGARGFALAETPDLDLLVERFAPRVTARFSAGLELDVLNASVALLGALRRFGIVRTLLPFAGIASRMADLLLPFGSDRGGMFVEAWGRDGRDRAVRAKWSLVAPAGLGPYVPTIPALILVRRVLAGDAPSPGARACVGMIGLEDFAPPFAQRGITTRSESEVLIAPVERALGEAFEHAPAAVRAAHRHGPLVTVTGAADVEGADNPLVWLVARIVGFPRAGRGVPVEVTFQALPGGREIWKRRIGAGRFQSTFRVLGPGRVAEQFGPISIEMSVSVTPQGVRTEVTGWRLGALALPRVLRPRSIAFEGEDAQGRYTFDAPIALPLIGRVTRYAGYLKVGACAGAARVFQAH